MSETQLTADNFDAEVLKSDVPVVVDFYADWCGPCKMMAPVLEQLAVKLDGKVKIAKIDVDGAQQVASKYGISSIPCLIIFKGGEEADRAIGFRAAPELQTWIEKNI